MIVYNLHSVHFVPVTHLFCNWKVSPLNLPPPFTHPLLRFILTVTSSRLSMFLMTLMF